MFKHSEETRDEYILTQLMKTLYATTGEGKSLIYKETKEKLMQDNCRVCNTELWAEGIKDNIDLCHLCYEKEYTKKEKQNEKI